MMVYVERRAADDVALMKDESFGTIRNQLCTFREGEFSAHLQAGQSHAEPDGFISIVSVFSVFLQVMTISPTAST